MKEEPFHTLLADRWEEEMAEIYLKNCQKMARMLASWKIKFNLLRSPVKEQGRIHDTISHGDWAGAVIWRAGAVRDAVYMTATVSCNWAGAVMQKPLTKR